jgi:hypothetical protein
MKIKLHKYLKVAFLGIGLSILSACPRPMPSYCSSYYRLPNEKRIEKINSSSIEELFDLQLCEYYAEPGDFKAATAISDGGEKNVPFLLSKLNNENDGHTKEEAIFLLSLMDSNNNLPKREEVVAIIEKTISEMKDDGFKDSAKTFLQQMKDISKNKKE